MSQAAIWAVMRAYGIPDVDLLVSLYEHSTVRMTPNDPHCATITFDTGVAQGSALSPLLFLVFMNALLGLITDRGSIVLLLFLQKQNLSDGDAPNDFCEFELVLHHRSVPPPLPCVLNSLSDCLF